MAKPVQRNRIASFDGGILAMLGDPSFIEDEDEDETNDKNFQHKQQNYENEEVEDDEESEDIEDIEDEDDNDEEDDEEEENEENDGDGEEDSEEGSHDDDDDDEDDDDDDITNELCLEIPIEVFIIPLSKNLYTKGIDVTRESNHEVEVSSLGSNSRSDSNSDSDNENENENVYKKDDQCIEADHNDDLITDELDGEKSIFTVNKSNISNDDDESTILSQLGLKKNKIPKSQLRDFIAMKKETTLDHLHSNGNYAGNKSKVSLVADDGDDYDGDGDGDDEVSGSVESSEYDPDDVHTASSLNSSSDVSLDIDDIDDDEDDEILPARRNKSRNQNNEAQIKPKNTLLGKKCITSKGIINDDDDDGSPTTLSITKQKTDKYEMMKGSTSSNNSNILQRDNLLEDHNTKQIVEVLQDFTSISLQNDSDSDTETVVVEIVSDDENDEYDDSEEVVAEIIPNEDTIQTESADCKSETIFEQNSQQMSPVLEQVLPESVSKAPFKETGCYSPIKLNSNERKYSESYSNDDKENKSSTFTSENHNDRQKTASAPMSKSDLDSSNVSSQSRKLQLVHSIVEPLTPSSLNNKKPHCSGNLLRECSDRDRDTPLCLSFTMKTENGTVDLSNTQSLQLEKSIVLASSGVGGTVVESTRSLEGNCTPPKVSRNGNVKRGKWVLGAKIGSGAFGTVYMGLNTATGTLMAVKTIKLEQAIMKDARREVEMLKSLNHPNIVRYYGAEIDSKYLHIFQEWAPAGSVTLMLQKFGPFPMAVLRSYLYQTLQGLAFLHDNNIMHRDIKGSNILVSNDGIVKLADFGASKQFAQLHSNMMLSLTMRGTPYFMAPEVFQEKYSTKADSWSVGCVAYQMVTGSPPWKDLGHTNPVSLFHYLQAVDGPPSMVIPEEEKLNQSKDGKRKIELLKTLMVQCFSRCPEDRPSAKELLNSQFFVKETMWDDHDHTECCSLFSPASAFSLQTIVSPIGATILSPIRHHNRNHDVQRSSLINGSNCSPVQHFLSPPLPHRRFGKTSQDQSPNLSPAKDVSGWPTWAKERHKQVEGMESSLDLPASTSNANVVATDVVASLLDSLAYSDSISLHHENYYISKDSSDSSLQGLMYVEDSPTSMAM